MTLQTPWTDERPRPARRAAFVQDDSSGRVDHRRAGSTAQEDAEVRGLGDPRLQRLLVRPGTSIRETLQCIDDGTVSIALMIDADGQLVGTISDGDVRRALLAGASLDDPVDAFVHAHPLTVHPADGRAVALDLMRAHRIAQVPEVDDQGRLQGLHVLHEIIGREPLQNWAVVLAGGRGTRLGDLTSATPKPMLPVAGRPILERLILHLVGSGIQRVYLSVGYLAEQIEQYFGDGSEFGCSVEYLRESTDQPLGTGGPLRLLVDEGASPTAPLLVLNGDLVTSFSVHDLLRAHARAGAAMTIGVKDYTHDVPFGVIKAEGATSRVIAIDEKPHVSWQVNAGVYVLDPSLLDDIPPRQPYPITELASHCLREQRDVLAWPLSGDWHDIGRPQELALARGQA